MLLLLLASGLSFVSYGLDQTQKVNYIIGEARSRPEEYARAASR